MTKYTAESAEDLSNDDDDESNLCHHLHAGPFSERATKAKSLSFRSPATCKSKLDTYSVLFQMNNI